jgi:hypothetical protein
MMRILPLCLLFMATACNANEPKQADDYNEAANKRIDPVPTPEIKEEPILGDKLTNPSTAVALTSTKEEPIFEDDPNEDTRENKKIDISDIYYQYVNVDEDVELNFYNMENKTEHTLYAIQYNYTPVVIKEGKTIFAYQIFEHIEFQEPVDKVVLEKVTFYRIRFSDVITNEFCVFKYPKTKNSFKVDSPATMDIFEEVDRYLRGNIYGYPSKFRCKPFANYDDDPKIKAKLPLLEDVQVGVIDGEPAR